MRIGAKVLSSGRARGALVASMATVALIAPGGTSAAQLDVKSMARESATPITCTQESSDPRKTDAGFASDSDGQSRGQGNGIPGVAWTFNDGNKSVNITFLASYNAEAHPITEIVVKIDDSYATCTLGRLATVGDNVTITNAGATASLSWIKLGKGQIPDPPSPGPGQSESPGPGQSESPGPGQSESPGPGQSESPGPGQSESSDPTASPTEILPAEQPSPGSSGTTLPGEPPSPGSSGTALPGAEPGSDPSETLGTGATAGAGSSADQSTTGRTLANTGLDARTVGLLTAAIVLLGLATTWLARRQMGHRG